MIIYFSQIYTEVGSCYPFTYKFQQNLSSFLSERTVASEYFIHTYGVNYELMIRLNASKKMQSYKVYGPTVFRKDNDIEYTIVIPYKCNCDSNLNWIEPAVHTIFDAVCEVLGRIEINSDLVNNSRMDFIHSVKRDAQMFD